MVYSPTLHAEMVFNAGCRILPDVSAKGLKRSHLKNLVLNR